MFDPSIRQRVCQFVNGFVNSSMDLSIRQWVCNSSMDSSTSMGSSIRQWVRQFVNGFVSSSMSSSIRQWVRQCVRQWVRQFVSGFVNSSVSSSMSSSIRQWVRQFVNGLVNSSMKFVNSSSICRKSSSILTNLFTDWRTYWRIDELIDELTNLLTNWRSHWRIDEPIWSGHVKGLVRVLRCCGKDMGGPCRGVLFWEFWK